jgi:hypothetical protein
MTGGGAREQSNWKQSPDGGGGGGGRVTINKNRGGGAELKEAEGQQSFNGRTVPFVRGLGGGRVTGRVRKDE